MQSTLRHSWHVRRLQDLPLQGAPVIVQLRTGRWRCRNEECGQKTFVEKLTGAAAFARRTRRVGGFVGLFGHAAGGRVRERLLRRLGMAASDTTILRQLKRHALANGDANPLRAVAIDDWSQRKGFNYGTIIIDLERRTVIDVLGTRSAERTAEWLKQRPEIEVVSRDRCGLYAQGIRQGAPQARQVADRFHLLQNLRDCIERQMTAVSRCVGRSWLPPNPGDREEASRRARRVARQALFDRAKQLHASGKTFGDIGEELGIGPRTVAKWIKTDVLPHRRRVALAPISPLYFQDFLARRWADGDRVGRLCFTIFGIAATRGAFLIWSAFCPHGDGPTGPRHASGRSLLRRPAQSTQRQAGRSRRSSPLRYA